MSIESNTYVTSALNATPVVRATGNNIARYGLALVIGWIGVLKFHSYEANNIAPLVANSPFMGWFYGIFSVETFSSVLGVVELVTALLLAVRPWYPKLSLLGSVLAITLFLSTLSFMVTTPGVAEASAGGFPLLSMTGQFLVKDVALLAVSLLTLADTMEAIARRAASTNR
ncbi:YkgB family protein [Mycobacterium sp. SMC-14]|uniref:YkgB family protein n=1 Tax=Mycobacterium sp. SMC-14 TaxID=3385968 RepID=UPI00390C52EB